MIQRDRIQEYVNLTRIIESIELIKSSFFSFFTIVLSTTFSDDLIENQRRDLAVLRKNHKENLRTYRKKIEIFKKLNLFILTSVNRFNLIYLRNQNTIFQKLSTLKKCFALTNRIKEFEIIRKYKICKESRSINNLINNC